MQSGSLLDQTMTNFYSQSQAVAIPKTRRWATLNNKHSFSPESSIVENEPTAAFFNSEHVTNLHSEPSRFNCNADRQGTSIRAMLEAESEMDRAIRMRRLKKWTISISFKGEQSYEEKRQRSRNKAKNLDAYFNPRTNVW